MYLALLAMPFFNVKFPRVILHDAKYCLVLTIKIMRRSKLSRGQSSLYSQYCVGGGDVLMLKGKALTDSLGISFLYLHLHA